MKKILLSVTALLIFGSAFAQLPRFGTKPNQNNTGSVLTLGYTTITGTLPTVTGSNLNYNMSLIYLPSSTGNTTINGYRLTTGKIGDVVKVIFGTSTGANIYSFYAIPNASSFSFNYNGALTVAGLKNANIEFMNNGNNQYVEANRFVEQ